MKSIPRYLCCFFAVMVAVCTALPAVGGNRQYNFRSVSGTDGLSANNVKCIVRDSYGFMWFGTKNGLNRFDGSKIKVYKCSDSSLREENNNIGSLYEDDHKRLWIGTDRGIYRYDPQTDRITFVNTKTAEGQMPDNWVQRITGDRKGNVWAVLPDQGIYRYQGDKLKKYAEPRPGYIKKVFPAELCVARNGNVWAVTTGYGIMKFDANADQFTHVNARAKDTETENASRSLCCICESPSGKLIVGTISGRIFEYNPANNTLYPLNFDKAGSVYLRYIECFDDELWMGTQTGLYVLNLKTGHTTELRENRLVPFSLTDNTVYTIYRDNEGGAWVGTMFGGVNYMPRSKFGFTCYGVNSGLSGDLVLGMATDRNGDIWVGTETSGVNVLTPSTGNIVKAPGFGPGQDIVLSMTTFDGCIYTGFSRGGLYGSPMGGSPKRVFPGTGGDNGGDVYAYYIDSRGTEWIGQGFALYRRMKGEQNYTHITETGYDWIYCIFESSDGTMWFGTMGNGLYRYNPHNGKFTPYVYDTKRENPSGLRSNSINSIMEDSSGNIWVSTDRGGLSRYDAKSDKFKTFGIAQGFPDDVIYTVLEDKSHNLWFGTNHGLVRFSPDSGKVVVFTEKDGIPFNQFNYKSAVKTADGRFYMGGVRGLVSFCPEDFNENASDSIPVYFTGLDLLNRDAAGKPGSGILPDNITFSDELSLNYNQSTFKISVAIPDFKHLGRFLLSYRLLPVSDTWIEMSDNDISFTNLPPGDYTLEVKAGNGVRENVRVMKIRILPPWWKSLGAYCVYVALVLIVLFIVMMVWQQHNERKMEAREKTFRDNRDKESYRSKVRFFTEIAHEIRTPLSLIDLPLEAIEEIGSDNPDIMRYVKVSRQNTRRLLQLTGQLLDFQKIDSQRLTLKNENIVINDFVQKIAERFDPSITLIGKHLEVSVEASPFTVAVDGEALTKIISNLLNNARKYATHSIKMSLSRFSDADGQWYKVSVSSDGKKITDAERGRIFQAFYQSEKSISGNDGVGIGLPLSSSLATLLGGSLVLEENSGDLNIFTLTLPATEPIVADEKPAEIHEYIVEKSSNQSKPRQDIHSVLLVEDNEGISSFIAEQLRNDFIVETAANGVEALEKLRKSSFDIVVTDIMMPQMDGLELCRTVKSDIDISHIPIVFMTAKNDVDTKVKGLQLGGEAYVEKPFSIKYLKQLLKSLLDNRSRLRESFQKNPFFSVSNMQMNKADEEFMDKVRKIIEENVSVEDFSVETVCDRMAMSRSSLLRKMKTVFNLSPAELIRVIRLKKAAELIKEGTYRIGDVGYMVGIASPSYFSKIFAKQFGMSPKDFEKQCKSKSQLPETNKEN